VGSIGLEWIGEAFLGVIKLNILLLESGRRGFEHFELGCCDKIRRIHKTIMINHTFDGH
jgi:hypothetical protein